MTAKSRFLLPLSALVVAALVAGLTWAVSSRHTSSPQVLRLLGTGSAARDMAAPATAEGGTSSGTYQLTGELPEGRPADAPVYALTGPYDTSRLAAALSKDGLTTDHASWWWSRCATPVAVGTPESKPGAEASPNQTAIADPPPPAPDSSVSSCAVAVAGSGSVSSGSSGTTTVEPAPQPTAPAMTEAQAREAARPVFEAVNLPIAAATTTVTPYGASIRLDPIVHGLRTSGYTTQVDLGADRQVQWASGYLGVLDEGDSYPLVSAREAFDKIPVPPVMDMMCPVTPDGKGCLPRPAPEVTGAELGLQLRQTGKGEQLLVPAWLFAVKGWDQPLGQIAIDEKWLGTPETPMPEPAQTKDGGTTPVPPPAPGSVEPAPPTKP